MYFLSVFHKSIPKISLFVSLLSQEPVCECGLVCSPPIEQQCRVSWSSVRVDMAAFWKKIAYIQFNIQIKKTLYLSPSGQLKRTEHQTCTKIKINKVNIL